MYETLMQVLRTALGSGALRVVMGACVLVVVLGGIAWACRPVREAFSAVGGRPGWRGAIPGVVAGVYKLLALVLLARLLVVAMVWQARLFEQQHGRVTERNRSAVMMKWGCPHEQRELTVTHTRKRVWVTRQLKVREDDHDVVSTDSFWKDENKPVQPVNGVLPTVVGTEEEERDVPVEQKSLVSADVSLTIRNNPRRLGAANYAGYDDTWRLRYVVANHYTQRTTAEMRFALPAATGLFDDLSLRVDGSNALDTATSDENALIWRLPMEPSSEHTVELGYQSRGLEHVRYIPKPMSQTGHYRVSIALAGVPADKLDYPIGSMPPAENLAEIHGDAYTLTWKLDNALTSYDIGIKLPAAEQPDYYFARLLDEAPVGLVLLLVMLVLARAAAGASINLMVVTVLALAYYLTYTLMGRLADVMDGFTAPFLVAALAVLAVVAWFRLAARESRFIRVQDVAGFGILAVLYPLAVVDADRTAFWMQWFYLGALVYACALLLVFRLRNRGPA